MPPKLQQPFSNTPLGIGINTVKGLPKAALDTGVGVARGLASDTLGLGRTIANTEGKALDYLTHQNQPDAYAESAPLPKALQPIFGSEPVKVVPQQYQDLKTSIQNSSIAKKMGLDKVAGPLGFGGVLAQNLLDFTPLGGSEDAAIKVLVKETDPEVIGGMLRTIGVHADVADKMAPHIAASSDPTEIKSALDIVKGTQAMHNEAVHNESLNPPHEPGTEVPKVIPETQGLPATPKESYVINAKGKDLSDIRNIISDVKGYVDTDTHDRIEIRNVGKTKETQTIHLNEPVAPEVRKMDIVRTAHTPETAEQLGYANKPIYRGGGTLDEKRFGSHGSSFSTDQKVANSFKNSFNIDTAGPEGFGTKGVVEERYLKPDAKVLTHENMPSELKEGWKREGFKNEYPSDRYLNKVAEYAKSNGYDAVDLSGFGKKTHADTLYENEVRILNHDALRPSTETETEHATHAEEQSKYIDSLSKEKVDGKPINKTPATQLAKLGKGPDGGSWESLVKGYSRNLPKAARVNLLDYLGTPEFVLEKIGLQKPAEMLQDAKDTYRRTLKKEIATISDWKGRVENDPAARPHSATRIFRYLNGDARYAKSEMTPTEVEVAGQIKTYLKGWADRLHLPEDNRIGNYITHIFDKDAVDLPGESAFDDPDLAVIMESQPAKSVYNPFLEKRVNAPGYKEDVWAALDAYVKRGSRKEAMDPALEALEIAAHKLGPEEYKYVTTLTHRINMRPTDIDKLFDNLIKDHVGGRFTERPTAYLTGKTRAVFYRGTIGGNASSALRNLSQGANTYAKLGERHTAAGYIKIFKHLATGDLSELYDQGILDEGLVQDKKLGIYKTTLQKADPILYGMFDLAEKINRGAAYYGAKSLYYSKNMRMLEGHQIFAPGASEAEAAKFGKRIVRETQFAFGQVDSPVILSSDLVKTLTQLGSYGVKQGEFLGRMIKNKEWGGLIRYTTASLLFVYTIGRAFGMKPDQLIPTIGLNAPIVSAASAAGDAVFGNTPQARASAVTQLENVAVDAIPAGAQLKKTIQGLGAYNAGKDTTATGKTRYTIPHNPGTLMQAALFGKSALPQAQAYYSKLDNPTKKKTPAKGGGSTLSI